eukprot:TRINITY_DN26913_c0_g1_i1.p1 TRINITY_DN26913_c0_g1~~TRINITY_DN26913_c0_g1_i1.p1  ORF type:complete len:127 (+),score=62.09 TRINITY_DN26913_c0_g1_i1:61-441(+)
MVRRPPRSTQSRSSAASDVYKRQELGGGDASLLPLEAYLMVLLHIGKHSLPDGGVCVLESNVGLAALLAAVRRQNLVPREPHDLHVVGAVSYTHLRAHETVLDLVCRLLLEKKKKHIHFHVNHIHN